MSQVRTLIVEDSPTQARALEVMLEADGDIRVVGTVPDARSAIEAVAKVRPDVVTMDLDVPAGGGQHAIERIMADVPTPILVISGTFTSDGEPPALAAIAAGAVDALPKPRTWGEREASDLRRQVRRIARVAVIARRPAGTRRIVERPRRGTSGPVVALAASTGGPMAIARVLEGLQALPAPVLVLQHIHSSFSASFVTWLEGMLTATTCTTKDGMVVRPGHIYVAPGDRHLLLGPDGRLALSEEPQTLHRPSADELFASLAEHAGSQGVGVVLTGMGDDGAEGASALRAAGGEVVVQDEESSVVWGMPRAALRRGAATRTLPLDRIAAAVREAVEARR